MTTEAMPAQGPVDVNVRPVIAAYKDHCGVSDDRFDTATDEEMRGTPNIAAAAFRGYAEYRAGWDAAVAAIAAEVERLTWALDHGGNKYRRPAGVDKLERTIDALRA
jgi:hypothetical protein